LDRLAPGRQTVTVDKYEIIVTDDGSGPTAEELIQECYPWARWVEGPRKGPAANRNNGARHARGSWLVFVDDDCLPDPNWLKAIWRNASAGPVEVIEGKTVTPDKIDNPFRQGVENLSGGNYWSCNLAIRREAFFAIGVFDEDFLEAGGEDMEFAFRIRKHQLKARFEENALVLHPARSLSLKQLIWRTLLDRWMLLYRIKTGNALPAGTLSIRVVLSLFQTQIMGLLRTTYHLFSRPDAATWRTRFFFDIWKWITFPIMLPYLVKWEFAFRRQVLSRSKNND
jgi:GT2 family glycosyltransferase